MFLPMFILLLQPLSILCHSFRDIDIYTTGFPRGDGQGHANIFRAVKHCLPGPVSIFFVYAIIGSIKESIISISSISRLMSVKITRELNQRPPSIYFNHTDLPL